MSKRKISYPPSRHSNSPEDWTYTEVSLLVSIRGPPKTQHGWFLISLACELSERIMLFPHLLLPIFFKREGRNAKKPRRVFEKHEIRTKESVPNYNSPEISTINTKLQRFPLQQRRWSGQLTWPVECHMPLFVGFNSLRLLRTAPG